MTALDESIAHWERLATGNREEGENPSASHCALCRNHNRCEGCPVNEATGNHGCSLTPYFDANFACLEHGLDSPEFRAAAQKELDFLKSLRPAGDISTKKNAE